jgi:hypothetical protein
MQVREVSIESVNGYVKLGRNYNLYLRLYPNERTHQCVHSTVIPTSSESRLWHTWITFVGVRPEELSTK